MRKRGRRLERAVEMMTSPSMRPVAGRTAAGPAAAFDAVGNAGDTGSSAISPTRASAYEWRDDNAGIPRPRRGEETTGQGRRGSLGPYSGPRGAEPRLSAPRP